jgi:D-specific alpha-keto acid dehydrogenase
MISNTPANPATARLTVFGCDGAEAALFHEIAPRFAFRVTTAAEPATEATARLAAGSRCISVSHRMSLAGATLLALSRAGVGYVSTRSVGCDHIDIGHAAAVGLRIGTVAYSPNAVADFTLMSILMVLRGAASTIRRTDARDYRPNEARGRELRDLTVGVVGTGRIGTAVIDRLRGFGCRILAHDRHPTAPAKYVPLPTLLRQSDIVTLHIPLTAHTRHLLDAGNLALMKPGSIVVNTGRGALVDTAALVSALEQGNLSGAALDVLEGEEEIFYTDHRASANQAAPTQGSPTARDLLHRLQASPNVLISPHIAYYTDQALHDTVENTLVACAAYEAEASHHG